MSDPRAKIKSVLYETDYDNAVLEVLAEGIFSGISDFVQGGMTNKLKGDLERGLKKALDKDNKKIIKGIDILKQAYVSRISKLDALKNKIGAKIDKNKVLSDQEKDSMKQSIDTAIADSQEILNSLSGELDDIEDEVAPEQNDTPKAPETAPDGEKQSKFKDFVGKDTPNEEPTTEPEASNTSADQEAMASADEILNKVNKVEPKKQTEFKKNILKVLTSTGPKLVKNAIKKITNIKEEVISEKLSLKHGLSKAAKEASDTISRSLNKDPELKSEYDALEPQKKEKVNIETLTTAIKLAHKRLGDEFFSEPILPSDAKLEPTSEPESTPSEPKVVSKEQPKQPILPDDAELEPAPEEPVANEPAPVAPTEPLFPDDAELEAPAEEPVAAAPDVAPEVTPEPKVPEEKPTVMNTLSNISLDGSSNFLKEKGLISSKSVPLYDALSDQGKKTVIDHAITILDKIVSSHKSKISEMLTADDLGLSNDVDLGSSHKGIIRNISANISSFIKRVYAKENKKDKAKPAVKPVAKAAPVAKEKPIEKPKIEPVATPVAKAKDVPKADPVVKTDSPTDPDSEFKNAIGDDLYNIMSGPDDKDLRKAAKDLYLKYKNSGRPVTNDKIRQSVDDLISRWDDQLNESVAIKEHIRNAIRGINEIEAGLTGATGNVKDHKLTTLTMSVGDIVSFIPIPSSKEPENATKNEPEDKQVKNKDTNNPLNPDVIKNVRRDVIREAAISAEEYQKRLKFKKEVEELDKTSEANKFSYGIIKNIDKNKETVLIQPFIAKRKLVSDKIKFKKIGKPIEIKASYVRKVEIPWSDFPKEYAKSFLIVFGISAAAIGLSIIAGKKALGKVKSIAKGIASQGDQSDKV